MTRIFSPQELNDNDKQLCCYINRLQEIVTACIKDIPGRLCERVIFPQERFLFEAPKDSYLEIYRYTSVGMLKDTISCSELVVKEARISDFN
jgi:hypothetical protein